MARAKGTWTDTPVRVLTIAIGAPFILLAAYWGGAATDGVLLILAALCAYELSHILQPARQRDAVLALLAVLTVTLAFILTLPGLFLLAVAILGIAYLGDPAPDKNKRYTVLIVGGIYIGGALGMVHMIREQPDGLAWTLALIAGIWMTDIFALIGGRLFGRRPFVPRISPGKTLEGALTGYGIGLLSGLTVALIARLPLRAAVPALVLVPALTILGDLVESAVKRNFGVKHSSRLLPGHGGFLDRMDGFFMATPVFYTVLVVMV